jgi:hypothetical protein
MSERRAYHCPICGYPDLTKPPRTASSGGSFETCPSCGFEFGVTDDDKGFSYTEWRRFWRASNYPWADSGKRYRPAGWKGREQLEVYLASVDQETVDEQQAR